MEHFSSIIPENLDILNVFFTGLGILCALSIAITASFVLVRGR